MKKKRIAALLCSLSLIGTNSSKNTRAMNFIKEKMASGLKYLQGNKDKIFDNFNKKVEDVKNFVKAAKAKADFDQAIEEIKGEYKGPEDKRLIPKEFINSEVRKICEQYLKPEFVVVPEKYIQKTGYKCKIDLSDDIYIKPIFTKIEKGRKVDLSSNKYEKDALDDNKIVRYDDRVNNKDGYYIEYYLIPTKMIENSKEFWEYYDNKLKEYAYAEDFAQVAYQEIWEYAGKYLFKERIINYSIKLIAELAAASLLVTIGVKYALHRANKSEQARRKKVEYDRKMKNQNDFDEMMKRINGHSSINYDKPWNEIEEIFEKLKDKAPHNAESIDKIKIKIKDFYSQSKANNFSKCIGISVNGTPGCGKTSFFLELMKNLGAEQPVIIGPADFDVDHKFLNVNQQVSGKWHIGSNERGYYAYGKLVAAIKHNEHPIIIVDELDKLPKSLRTLLWNAFKTGEIEIEGKKQSCKGAIFLFPCNQPLDDETKNISEFKFNTPNKESYKKALAKILTQIASFAKEKYKLDLEYSDSILDWMAQKCVNDDEGMRSIKVCKRFINSAIEVKYNSTYESKILTRLKLDKDETGHLICVEP